MRHRIHWQNVLAIAVGVNAGLFAYRPGLLPQLGLMISGPVIVVVACVYAVRSRDRWLRRMVVICSLIAAFPFGVIVGHRVRDLDFRVRRRERYQAIVDRIRERRSSEVSAELTRLPVQQSLAYTAFARRTQNGTVRVEFFWGGGFPVKHTAYIYTSTGVPTDGAWDQWWYRRLDDHWFEAGD